MASVGDLNVRVTIEGMAPVGDDDGPDLLHEPVVTPRAYQHVTKSLYDRPWAMQPSMLRFMGELLRYHSEGNAFTPAELRERLAAAAAENGPRAGGVVASGVAVIPMYGVISQRANIMSETSGGTSVAEMRSALRDALNDPSVRAVVFDVDSPGGSVDGITEFATELRQLRRGAKPIVAQVNTLAASAAYWLAASMSEIVVTPSGEVGSVGVYAMHQDVSVAAEKEGVKTSFISAGEFKTEGNQFEPLSEDARAHIQSQVNENYHMFLADVAKGRGVSVDAVAEGYGRGRTLLAKGALAAGMADRIDTLDATVSRLMRPSVAGRASAEGAPIPTIAEITPVETAANLPAPVVKVAAAAPTKHDPDWNRRVAGLLKR